MPDVALLIATYTCNALWQVPLMAAAGSLACRTLRRLGPAVEHRVWVGSLLLAAALPLQRALLAVPWGAAPAGARGSGTLVLLAGGPERLQGGLLAVPRGMLLAIAVLYLAVMLFFAVRLVWSLAAAVRLEQTGWPLTLDAEHEAILQEVAGSFELCPLRLLGSSALSGPVTLSLGRPALLLPERFVERTLREDFCAAVAHECAHIRRNDFRKQVAYQAVGLLVAFHPVSWFLRRQIAGTREMVCDELAMRAVGGPLTYVSSLLRLAGAIGRWTAMDSHAIGIFDANILERRIMFLRAEKQTTSMSLRSGLLAAGVLCLLVAAVGCSRAALGLAPAAGGFGQAAGEVYRIGHGVSAPKVLAAPNPEYPASARQNAGAFKGTCLLGLVVDASGQPKDVHVVRSLGKDFDANAVKAVERYRFAPALHEGAPVAVELRVEVSFSKF